MTLPTVDSFTVTETLTAADELGLKLSVEEARQIAFEIVTSRFPVCVREHLKRLSLQRIHPPD